MALNLEKQLLFATNSPAIPLPSILSIPNLPANTGTIAAILYSTLYVLMEPVAGGLLAPLLLGGTAYANHLTATYGSTANYWALGIHVCSWIAQFVGHGSFEGRAPALLDNLVQAFFLAPFFVWFEILFFFGYRPELKGRLDKAVAKEVDKFRDSKMVKKTNGQTNGAVKAP
ncbi:hypothetical protein LTR16_000639 [Cryomyces antarcticus]|uniref:DUF962 domain-containing protein n=1 Tax=Cryomyces antarcticus TaxID=329879 RepID=A0ABR0M969_9PEZI|nr:hypothetical protein LTR16_000639 [Cryomyces antarcticus]